ncbi:MAG TPA: FlgO family outer membrane protein, partial [Pyrinomonadaceae bacterium]|nr:FlgO family outer membrane protein [Pyrinomonadaceae bacterium]
DVTKNEEWVRRFEQEARAASALNHPNIITIYEVGQMGESHFISAEFIEGDTLRQRLGQRNLTVGEALDIAIQVAMALVAAHAAGIIHRDIKPENVMLRPDGYVKVLDFGLAKFSEQRPYGSAGSNADAATNVDTDPGTVMGTVSYMSPEQASGRPIDARSDIFSLGVLLYEMVSGRRPFEGTTPSEIIVSIIQKRARPLARYAPEVPPELERIVAKSLSKNREDRYQTLKDMLIDLRRLKQQYELEAQLIDLPDEDLAEHISSRQHLATVANVGVSMSTGKVRAITQQVTLQHHPSSAEYIVAGIKQYKKIALIIVSVALVASAALWYYVATRPINSIAVLPFMSINPDPGTEELGDEIAEHIINDLSQSPGLRVISFSAVQQYKGQHVDLQAIARELNVRAILVGRVSKRDSALTVSAELIDTRDKTQLWGMNRAVRFSDFLLVPDEIVAGVANKIGPSLSVEGKKKRDAETLYIKGRNAWNKRTTDSINEATRNFSEALELYPNYALAYAGLADCYNMLATYGAKPPKEAFPKAHDAAIKALAIDNNLAEGHAALAYTTFRGDWNLPEAEKEFKQAIRLNDNYASAHQWYANYLAAQGRFDEAIQETRRTQEIDKTSLIINAHFGLMNYFAHRFDQSIAECNKTVALDPTFYVARRYLGLSYAQKGMYKEALEEFEKAIAGSSGSPLMRAEYASTLALSGDTKKAQTELDGLIALSKQKYISAYHIATVYAGLKDKDHAFEWLEKGLQERADWMVFLNVDPRFDSLHSDPRFKDLQQRMNLR